MDTDFEVRLRVLERTLEETQASLREQAQELRKQVHEISSKIDEMRERLIRLEASVRLGLDRQTGQDMN